MYTVIMYPYHIVNDFPGIKSVKLWLLVIAETCCLFDIIINFFLQEMDEQENSRLLPLAVVANNYLLKGFLKDFFVLLPIGWIMSLADKRLKFFWCFKAIRVIYLNEHASDHKILPIIKSMFKNV